MEKLGISLNGQWSLNKSEIDKKQYKFRHVKSSDSYSHYNIEHRSEGQVGHGSIDHKTGKANVVLPQPRFDHHKDFLETAMKGTHAARNASTDN